jgi:hypothetical protein
VVKLERPPVGESTTAAFERLLELCEPIPDDGSTVILRLVIAGFAFPPFVLSALASIIVELIFGFCLPTLLTLPHPLKE